MTRVLIVSDLHLGIGRQHPVEDFEADAEFEQFAKAEAKPGTELVLLGDTFDLWQTALADAEYTEGDPAKIPLAYDVAAEIARLDRIEKAHPGVFRALRDFAEAPGCTLTITPGNHDHSLIAAEVQAAVHAKTSPRVRFENAVDRAALGLYAEHGNQHDGNNRYDKWDSPLWQDEAPGYFFVKLFWNRLETLDADLDDAPGGWRSVWHYLRRLGRPRLIAAAIRYWFQYRRDPRVPRRVDLASSDLSVDAAPDLLGAGGGAAPAGHVFSTDPLLEDALRSAYLLDPDVKEAVDEIAPGLVVPSPAHGPQAEAEPAHLGGRDDVNAADRFFVRSPPWHHGPLDPKVYRFIVMGHTHHPLDERLPVGAWYLNTGTWTGRGHPRPLPVVEVAAAPDGRPEARYGHFWRGTIAFAEPRR